MALPAGEVRHEAADHDQRCEPLRVVIRQKPSAIVAGRSRGEIKGSPWNSSRASSTSTNAASPAFCCQPGVPSARAWGKTAIAGNRSGCSRVQPDSLRQRAYSGPDAIRAIIATAMQGQYDRPCPRGVVATGHVNLVSVLHSLHRDGSVKKTADFQSSTICTEEHSGAPKTTY